jgi:uncharacterized protein (DUF4415 family)
MSRKPKEPVFDDDNPEWTAEDFAVATRFEGGIKAKDLTPEILARVARRGPQKTPTKVAVSIRLSPEVISHFKEKGPGWQSRIDDALRKIAKIRAS